MLKDLMEQFVCARLVRAETLDLSLFRFDPDQSFCVFFLDAEGTLYGRFGSRSDFSDAEREISLAGLKAAMEKTLEWHRLDASAKSVFAAKRGVPPQYRTLGDFPSQQRRGGRGGRGERGEREGRGGGSQGARCTHCHNLRSAEQMTFLQSGEAMPERVLFSWPMPDVVGLHIDPQTRATVQHVAPNSAAETAGFQAGDSIVRFQGQPILSTADLQFVLDQSADQDTVHAEVERDGQVVALELALAPGWRRAADVSWRTTTGMLRRTLLAGVEYSTLSPEDCEVLELEPDSLALRAESSPGRGSTSEVREGDVLVALDGDETPRSPTELLLYLAQHPGEEVTATVLREGALVDLRMATSRE